MAQTQTVVNKTYDEIVKDSATQAAEMVGQEVADRLKESLDLFKKEWEAKTESEKRKAHQEGVKRSLFGHRGQKKSAAAGRAAEFMLAFKAGQVQGRDARLIAEKSGYGERVLEALGEVKSLMASSFSGGGVLIPETIAPDFIEALYDSMVVRQLGARTVEMEGGHLALGKMTGSATASWIAEGAPIAVSQQSFGDVNLVAKKLGCLVPISNDLLRRPTLPRGVDVLIQDDMTAVMARAEDIAMIRGDGTQGKIKGVRDSVVAANRFNATAAASATVQQINGDLFKAMFKVMNANIPCLSCGWILSVREKLYLQSLISSDGFPIYPELNTGELRGFQVGYTSALPINLERSGPVTDASEIYFGDFSQLIIGETLNMLMDQSQDASFVDENGATIHGFASDRSLFRVIHEVDAALRHLEAFAVIEAVAWGNGLG